jgi:hypothetical protein
MATKTSVTLIHVAVRATTYSPNPNPCISPIALDRVFLSNYCQAITAAAFPGSADKPEEFRGKRLRLWKLDSEPAKQC